MTPEIDIMIDAEGWSAIDDLEALTARCVNASVSESGGALAPDCEMSVTFCDDAAIRELNARWRGKDSATNVLSFPTPGVLAARPLLGDLVIAFETVAREAGEQGKSLRDHAAHMVIHGFLHLIGYDHETPGEAEAMEAMERRVARAAGLADPYADDAETADIGNTPRAGGEN